MITRKIKAAIVADFNVRLVKFAEMTRDGDDIIDKKRNEPETVQAWSETIEEINLVRVRTCVDENTIGDVAQFHIAARQVVEKGIEISGEEYRGAVQDLMKQVSPEIIKEEERPISGGSN